ncbi:S-adenosyl-L-methionine-dependent methyltransferase [Mariannaea sp. PMI_226]|nr:S-adenosyl-L-methionine-dependent methyltransferase [Mariannaea sp. PMI_226]
MVDEVRTGSKSPSTGTSSPRSIPRPSDGGLPSLEPDTADLSDADSTIDNASVGSGTTSLASSIAKYRFENGRTYHAYKDGSYLLPNDDTENERLDLQHHLCFLTFNNKLYTCPAGENQALNRVLDAGCGTGVWAMDFADEHPETIVIGADLSPIQPSLVPPNATFLVDDLESEWTYHQPFDFIYLRFLVGSIRDWDKLLGQTFDNLSSGGWIETVDAVYPLACDDGTVTDDLPIYKWSNLMREGAAKAGLSLDTCTELKQKMIDRGFTNVTEQWYRWPMNSWPKEPKFKNLGAWSLENVLSGLSALSLALFTRVLGWTREEVELFLVDVRRDLRNKNIHGYWRILAVSGQKVDST